METKKLYSLFGLPLIAFNMSVMALEDVKVYPGALCQSETNTQSIVRNTKGAMLNTGTDPQIWICPIVRDRPDSIEDATIVVSDRNGNPNADVSCTIFSRMPTGQPVDFEAQGSTGTGVVALEMAPATQQILIALSGMAITTSGALFRAHSRGDALELYHTE